MNIFSLFPESNIIMVAGIYNVPLSVECFELSKHIKILSQREQLNDIYFQYSSKEFTKPNHYIISTICDDKYTFPNREIKTIDDAESAITLAQLSLSIYYNFPFFVGEIVCFKQSHSPMILSRPVIHGNNYEIKHIYNEIQLSPFYMVVDTNFIFDDKTSSFFSRICNAYSIIKDKRWTLSAFKFLSGLTQPYLSDSILDFSVSMEALLNQGDSISFKLSLYTSLLVGESYKERLMISDDITEFYKLRNKLVHGQISSFNADNTELVKRVTKYLNKAIKISCGKTSKELFNDIKFLSYLGAPRHSVEKSVYKISEEDVLYYVFKEGYPKTDLYKFYINYEEDDQYSEILLDLIYKGEKQTLDINLYLPNIVNLPSGHYSYWFSKDESGHFIFYISYNVSSL